MPVWVHRHAGATCEAGGNVVGWSGLGNGFVWACRAAGCDRSLCVEWGLGFETLCGVHSEPESHPSLSGNALGVGSNDSATLTSPVICLYVSPFVFVCVLVVVVVAGRKIDDLCLSLVRIPAID